MFEMSLSKSYSPNLGIGQPVGLVGWAPIFLMSFTCSSGTMISRKSQVGVCTCKTQRTQIPKGLGQVFSWWWQLPWRPGFRSTPLETASTGPGKGLGHHTGFASSRDPGRPPEEVVYVLQSHIITVKVEAPREVDIGGPQMQVDQKAPCGHLGDLTSAKLGVRGWSAIRG